MSDKTKIQWSEASWNPLAGCSRVSSGCTRCYAERTAYRLAAMGNPYYVDLTKKVGGEIRWTGEVRFVESALDQPLRWKKPRRIFVNSMSDLFHEKVSVEWIDRIFAVMALVPNHTFQILTKRPDRMLAYLRDPDTTARWLYQISRHSALADKWAYQEADAANWMLHGLLNAWLGVSIEDQATADERIPLLLQTPAAVRWVSYEPALGPVDFCRFLPADGFTLGNPEVYEQHLDETATPMKQEGGAYFASREAAERALGGNRRLPRSWFPDRDLPGCVYALHGSRHDGIPDEVGSFRLTSPAHLSRVDRPHINWIVVGGESGPSARPLDLAWPRQTIAQGRAASVSVFVKQIGARPWWDGLGTPPPEHVYLSTGVELNGKVGWALECLRDRKGGSMEDWASDLRVRDYPT